MGNLFNICFPFILAIMVCNPVFSDEIELVLLRPYKLEVHPKADLMPNAVGCAVIIEDETAYSQNIVTVGEGESETLSCHKFVEAGLLPSIADSIGLIYEFESGPNSIFPGAVIISRDPKSGDWYRNEEVEGNLTVNSAYPSIEKLRNALQIR